MSNWTEREDTVLKARYKNNRPISDIAEELGRTEGAVRGRASALGVSKAQFEEIEKIGFENEAACPYCGQISITGGDCNCEGAKRARRIEAQIWQAKQAIDEIFGEQAEQDGKKPIVEENIAILKTVAEQIANYKLHSASFVLSSGTRAKLTRGSKGVIKIARTETQKDSAEVEE